MTVCHYSFSGVTLPIQNLRMSQYLNMKQLYFLLFLAAIYGIGMWLRGDFKQEKTPVVQEVSSSYQAGFRERPYTLSPLAACQQDCRSLSDSSLALLLQYGAIKREQGDTLTLQGKDLQGMDYWVTLIASDTLHIESLNAYLSSYACDCPR